MERKNALLTRAMLAAAVGVAGFVAEPALAPRVYPDQLITRPVSAEVEKSQRTRRERPFASAPVIELNRGDALLLWGSEIEAQGQKYTGNVVLGVLAVNDLGSTDDVTSFDGFRMRGSGDVQMVRLPQGSGDLAKQREALQQAINAKINTLLIPGGSARAVRRVIVELSQDSLTSPIRQDAKDSWSVRN